MEVTKVHVQLIDDNKNPMLRGFATVTFDDCFVVRNIRIIQNSKRMFCAMPNTKLTNGNYIDLAFPTNRETREMIEKAILDKFEELK